MEVFVAILVGIVSGVAAAAIFWWLQFRVMRARIEVGPRVAHFKLHDRVSNVVQIHNRGHRDAIEVVVTIRLRLVGRLSNLADVVTIVGISTPLVRRGQRRLHAIQPERMPLDERHRLLPYLPDEMQASFADGEPVDVLQILRESNGSTVEVHVFSTDRISGARSYAVASYTVDDFGDGLFTQSSFETTGVYDADATALV